MTTSNEFEYIQKRFLGQKFQLRHGCRRVNGIVYSSHRLLLYIEQVITIAICPATRLFLFLLVKSTINNTIRDDKTKPKDGDIQRTISIEMTSNELSLNDVVMPKCYTRALWVYDYKIDDLEKPFVDFVQKFCPSALGQIAYDPTKPNSGRLVEESRRPANRIFSRAEQLDTPVAQYINCSFQDLDVFPYSALPTDESPLLFLHQITVRDGTLLAIGIHHQFSDGHGFFTLIERFSQWVCHPQDQWEIRPFVHDRSLLKPAAEIRYPHVE